MYEIGRVCMKIAGRDAGKYGVVVDEEDGRVVLEGQTRRRAVNPDHLEPLEKTVNVKKGASFADVKQALEGIGVEVADPTTQKEIVKSKQK